jgi:TolA-binding protein
VADFDRIVKDYPLSQEREMALLQKGLTLGQIENYQPMIATFRQLLKDYPNSSGAPQANYWIGWAAFESKKYEEAIAPLQKARELNPDEFGERTSIRLIVAYQNLNQKENAAQEIDRFVAADPKQASLVADICRWLGVSYFDERNFAGAVKYLELLTKNVEREKFDKGIWLIFGRALTEVQRYPDAATAFNTYLELATEPTDRSQGFLALAKSQLRAKEFDPATKSAEQALALQPEGKLNAEARILLGDVEFGRGNFENAAKSYLAVAVLYEDPEVTPRALEHAYRAFREAGNLPQADKTMSELKQRFPNYPVSQTRSTAG